MRDHVVDVDEECDDGNRDQTDACTNSCKEARCGDGLTYEGIEGCDDGNDIDGDACTNACTIARCGDGFWALMRVGDDGNDSNLDRCTNACRTPVAATVFRA